MNFYKLAGVCLAQLSLVSAVFAQDLNAEIDAEIEQMYQKPNSTQAVQSTPITQVQVAPSVVQPVAPTVQKQPETVVESSPLSASRADQIRKGRQEEELRTETKIVEKLEQSRLEDEKRRAAVLFGDKFETLQNQQNQNQQQNTVKPVAPVVQPVEVVPVQTVTAPTVSVQAAPSVTQAAPAPIVVNQNETLTRDAVREEVRAALTEDSKAILPTNQQRYFSAMAGIGQYPDVDAIQGNYSLGAAFGTRFDYFLVEGSFLFSNYSVDAYYLNGYGSTSYGNFDMNQYQGTVSAKYQLLGGFVRPVVGGLVSYSYRKYSLNQQYYTNGVNTYAQSYSSGGDFSSSHAIDLGIITGVDLEFNDKTSFGVDFKYMFNMSAKTSGATAAGYNTVENLQYFTTGIFARVNF